MPVNTPSTDAQELRCMSCGAWLEKRDFSCGLSQHCVNCCLEPAWMHDDAEEEYER